MNAQLRYPDAATGRGRRPVRCARADERRGMAYILALVLLTSFMALAGIVVWTGLRCGRQSGNLVHAQMAQLSAESGLFYAARTLSLVAVPSTTTTANLLVNIATALGNRFNGTPNLAGLTVIQDSTGVTVPWINWGPAQFQIRVAQSGTNGLLLYVAGCSQGVTRTVAMDMRLTRPVNTAFDYGVASQGTISVSGNAEILGKNALNEASVISTTTNPVAIQVSGSCRIDGDLSSTTTPTSVVISGSPTVAGSQDPLVIAQHVHFGVDAPTFPTIDTSVFSPLCTSVIDSSSDLSHHGTVFNNVRVKARTNPTFSSDVVLNGIVYIEAPNIVTFTSKVTLNGIVATDMTNDSSTAKISFAGQVEAFGVEALPDLPQYAAVKQMLGTFIAAPGFDVSFAGQFSTINGTVAADKLTFSGQAEGTILGSVIGMSNLDTNISGTVKIVIDREHAVENPAGFSMPLSLLVVQKTYREIPRGP